MYGFLLKNVPQPITVVNNIDGQLYDADYVPISFEAAVEKMCRFEREMIIKPSLNSDSGHNVSQFRGNNRKVIDTLLKNS